MPFPPPSQQQARVIWLAVTGLAVAALLGLLVALIWGLSYVIRVLSPVLWPLAMAGVLAYLLDPVVDFLQRKGSSRPRSIIAVFAMALLIVAGFFGSVVPQLLNETRDLAGRIPAYAVLVEKRVERWVSKPPAFVRKLLEREQRGTKDQTMTLTDESGPVLTTNSSFKNASLTNAPNFLVNSFDQQTLQTVTSWLATALPRIGSWLFGQVGRVASWFGVLAGLALVPVYTFYFLLEKEGISARWTDYLPVADSGFKKELVFILNSVNNYLISFFRGQVLVAISDGILYGIGFLLIGLPYALLIGAMATILTMIPFLGAIVTCVTALIIAVVQFEGWLHPLLVLAVFGCVQALEGLVISPKIMGGRVGLHPVTIIISVMVGTTLLGGLLGGILAIPLTAALRVVMFRYVWRRPSAKT